MKALKETPEMELLTIQPGNYNRLISMQVMENLLQRYPKIDLVLAANDEQALGCVEAIDAVGRLKEIKVTGIDGNADAATSILQGRLFCYRRLQWARSGLPGNQGCHQASAGEKSPTKSFFPSPSSPKRLRRSGLLQQTKDLFQTGINWSKTPFGENRRKEG